MLNVLAFINGNLLHYAIRVPNLKLNYLMIINDIVSDFKTYVLISELVSY